MPGGLDRREGLELALVTLLVVVVAVLHVAGANDVLVFFVAAAALAALARLVGTATEQLGGRLGSGAAGVGPYGPTGRGRRRDERAREVGPDRRRSVGVPGEPGGDGAGSGRVRGRGRYRRKKRSSRRGVQIAPGILPDPSLGGPRREGPTARRRSGPRPAAWREQEVQS